MTHPDCMCGNESTGLHEEGCPRFYWGEPEDEMLRQSKLPDEAAKDEQ